MGTQKSQKKLACNARIKAPETAKGWEYCEFVGKSPQGLAVHKARAHGIEGTSRKPKVEVTPDWSESEALPTDAQVDEAAKPRLPEGDDPNATLLHQEGLSWQEAQEARRKYLDERVADSGNVLRKLSNMIIEAPSSAHLWELRFVISSDMNTAVFALDLLHKELKDADIRELTKKAKKWDQIAEWLPTMPGMYELLKETKEG